MLNYVVDPAILKPYMPPGTVPDLWKGEAMISLVGFMFNETRVLGIKWPFHTHFEEVNLRFYIKQEKGTEVKRGVGFVSEIVPRPLIATIANKLYNERYRALPMKHTLHVGADEIAVSYEWRHNKKWHSLSVKATNELQDIAQGSDEEFILEHYHGYNMLDASTSVAYEIAHPRWQVFPVTSWHLDADIEGLYGKEFAAYIDGATPRSVMLAKGSEVIIAKPKKLIVP